MTRMLCLCLFLALFFSLPAQKEEKQDNDFTFVDEDGAVRNAPLEGTVLLPFTNNYLSVMNSGYVAVKVEKADCSENGDHVYREEDKIDRVVFTDSTIEVHLRVYDNCCYDFLWDPCLSDDGVLDLKYTGYGGICGCRCCFGHVITFEKEYDPDDKIEIREIRVNGKGSYIVNQATK